MSIFNRPATGGTATAPLRPKTEVAPAGKAAPVDPRSIFTGIVSNARPLLSAEYIRPGHYICRINNCKLSRNRKGIVFAAVEMTVVHVVDDDQGKGHHIGHDITFYTDQNSDYFGSEIQGFIAGILGVPPGEVSDDNACEIFVPEGQISPLANFAVEVHARNVVTRNNTDFTRVKWVREVPAKELISGIPADAQERFWPGGILQQLAQAQQAQA